MAWEEDIYNILDIVIDQGTGKMSVTDATTEAKVDLVKTETDKIPATIVKIDAIKAKTDNLPVDTNALLNTIAGYIDTEITAIKTETDKISAEVIKTTAIKVATDQVGTLVNTGGTASLSAIIGDVANSSIVARLSAIASYIDTEVAAIKAKTDNLPTDTATQLNTIAGYIDTEVAAIKTETDKIPATITKIDGEVVKTTAIKTSTDQIGTLVNTGGVATLTNIIGDVANSSIVARLTSIASYIDTEVAAIKAKTDNLPTNATANSNLMLGDTLGFRFKVNVETAGASGVGKFALPFRTTTVCSCTVHWGDGKSDVITAYNQTEATHTYASNGIYEIKIVESADKVSFYGAAVLDRLKLVEVINIPQQVLLTVQAFRSCTNMTTFNSYAKIKLVGDSNRLFSSCSGLTTFDLSILDFTDVTLFNSAFESCSNLVTLNMTNSSVSKITSLASTFYGCSKLTTLNLTGLNFSALTSLRYTFAQTKMSSIDMTPFANSPLTEFDGMLYQASVTSFSWTNRTFTSVNAIDYFLQDCITVASVNFSGCSFPALVSNAYNVFDGCTALTTANFTNCNFSVLKTMYAWFQGCIALTTVTFTGVTSTAVTDAGSMFEGCTSLVTVDTSPINFANCTSFGYMFSGCTNLTSARIDLMNVTKAATGNSMLNFATGVTFSTTEYSNALIYWASLAVNSGVICGMGNSKYNAGAVAARLYLTGTKGWTITDGGVA